MKLKNKTVSEKRRVPLTGRKLRAPGIKFVTHKRRWVEADFKRGGVRRPFPDELEGKVITRRYYASTGENACHKSRPLAPGEYAEQYTPAPTRLYREYTPARKPKTHGATGLTSVLSQIKQLERLRSCSTGVRF